MKWNTKISRHIVWNAWHSILGMWRHFPPQVSTDENWIYLYLSSVVDTNYEINIHESKASFNHCIFVRKGTNGILLKILIRNRIQWTKNSLRRQPRVPRKRENPSKREHIRRVTYILTLRKNFDTELFKYIKQASLYICANYHKYHGTCTRLSTC